MERSRAYRKHQHDRVLRKTKRILQSWKYLDENQIEIFSRKLCNNRQNCSCDLCKGPRYRRKTKHILL
jgi:hypothetical protein